MASSSLMTGVLCTDAGSVSEVTEDYSHEVTHEEHIRQLEPVPAPRTAGNNNRFRNIRKRATGGRRTHETPMSDSATAYSLEGKFTVTSLETVKASNKTAKGKKSKKTRWSKLKRMIGVKKSSNSTVKDSASSEGVIKQQQQSLDASELAVAAAAVVPPVPKSSTPPMSRRKRLENTPEDSNTKATGSSGVVTGFLERVRSSSPATAQQQQDTDNDAEEQQEELADDSIRGRLDGIDVIALGGAQMVPTGLLRRTRSSEDQNSASTGSSPGDYHSAVGSEMVMTDDFPKLSFVGTSLEQSPADLVSSMLWNYGGRNKAPPEMILDGFVPGSNDRWTVRIEKHMQDTAATSNDKNDDDDEEGPVQSTKKLWKSLWGPNPAPTIPGVADHSEPAEDLVLLLAAECSVPIDIDEGTFMIDTPQHLRSIHEIAVDPLSTGNFDLALSIFEKLLKGLTVNTEDASELSFLKGTTVHNIGMIQLWKGDYKDALASFEQAIQERQSNLPEDHPDIVVSLVRKGTTLFALERFDEAVAAFEQALPMTPDDHLIKAKVQNNLGVVYFHQMDFIKAIKQFTMSLETQRAWLDTPVRREPLIVDATVTMNNMGRVYVERTDCDLACHVYEEALSLQTTIFHKDSESLLETRASLAIATARKGNVENALQMFKSCLKTKKERYGQNSAPATEILGLMGYLYTKIDSFENAETCLNAVRNWQQANLDPQHPACEQLDDIIQSCEDSVGRKFSIWV